MRSRNIGELSQKILRNGEKEKTSESYLIRAFEVDNWNGRWRIPNGRDL